MATDTNAAWKTILVIFGLVLALALVVAGFLVPAVVGLLLGIALWIGAVRGRRMGADAPEE